MLNRLEKQHTVAGLGFNRWLMPPAALAIHLCIGMAYGFSVFWLPLSKAIGITQSHLCPASLGFWQELFITDCDWKISTLGWMYTLFFVFLGSSAALWGHWLEHAGPRKAGVVSTFCWCGGMLISAVGIHLHQFWIMLIGSGVIGGIGLGLGYISPVSMLIKWFPDRRGMATGMAIMGFGGGAMIGSPLATALMNHFATNTNVGVEQTFVTMAGIYFIFMLGGAFSYRLPNQHWQPKGWIQPTVKQGSELITVHHVHVKNAFKIKQFWLLWLMLCMNVSAGIGVLGMSSPMLQEIFGGKLIGLTVKFQDLNPVQLASIASIAAGFTALLSLFNIGGRFFWATLSDRLGRKLTFNVFFIIGSGLYLTVAYSAIHANLALFVVALCVVLSFYGGGFATIPAYLADLFGTQMVGAIHGRLLTAWATAGIIGPVIVNYMRDYQLALGATNAQVYDHTMWILAGLLWIGLIANGLIRPVETRWFMNTEEMQAAEQIRLADESLLASELGKNTVVETQPTPIVWLIVSWTIVLIPLGWGIFKTATNVMKFLT